MLGVSLVIQLVKVYVEPVFPWDLGAQRLGTGNRFLVVLVREPRNVVVGDLAGFPRELKKPEGAIVIRWSAGSSRYASRIHFKVRMIPGNIQAASIFANHPSCVVTLTRNTADLTAWQ